MDNIQIKRGTKAKMPQLLNGELGYCADTRKLYIGTSGGNICLSYDDSGIVARLKALEEKEATKVE